jgi:hypothetical protein
MPRIPPPHFATVPAPRWSAEHELWAAVLADALALVSGEMSGTATQFEQRAARRWLSARGEQIGGFAWVCQMLGLEPQAVRVVIRRAAEWVAA